MNSTVPVTLGGSPVPVPRHVCAFFNDADEEYDVLLPFIREGFSDGDKAIHILAANRHSDHLARLRAAGVDTAVARGSGQLELKDSAGTYLSEGRFDPDRMLALFEEMADMDRSADFSRRRFVCQMEWAAGDAGISEPLIDFESRVNGLWMRHDDAVVCTYNMTKFGAETVIDILRTHPMVIIGGVLQHNPFFVTPEKFLIELRARRARRSNVI